MSIIPKIKNDKNFILVVILLLLITISFESAQQLFYLIRFNFADNPSFIELFKYQSMRWVIWLLLVYPIYRFIKDKIGKDLLINDFYKLAFLITSIVVINILIISILQIILFGDQRTFEIFINEYVTFYTFQKGPIYTLGYISISVILYFYLTNKQLQIDVLTINDLQNENNELYLKLKETINEKSSVLNIKIGNKQKIIPVDNIYWIEADDYCVKVHTTDESAYTMRTSLKALEQKLDNYFLRVHRKAIVNMKMVKEIQKNGSSIIILKNQTEISIANSKIKFVKEFIT